MIRQHARARRGSLERSLTKERLLHLYVRMTHGEVARHLGRHRVTLWHVCENLGVPHSQMERLPLFTDRDLLSVLQEHRFLSPASRAMHIDGDRLKEELERRDMLPTFSRDIGKSLDDRMLAVTLKHFGTVKGSARALCVAPSTFKVQAVARGIMRSRGHGSEPGITEKGRALAQGVGS